MPPMNRFLSIILTLLISLTGFSQTSEQYNGETINLRDVNNHRQGVWIKFDAAKKVEEKGSYIDNKKEGIWIAYYPSGKIKHEITYVKNRPDGYAKFYYEDGVVSEEGIWKINKWVGEYKYFHENGTLKYDWKYTESGKRTGEQKYYYADGSLMIKGDWTEGKKIGVLSEFYPDGSIKSEINFNDGKIEVASVKEYAVAEKPAPKQMAPGSKSNAAPKQKSTGGSAGYFTQTGNFKTYNEFKKVDRDGEFVKGKFMEGKRYFYDDEGNLTKTLIYKNGKVTEAIENNQ